MSNWDEIKKSVEANGDLLTVTMEELRDVHGAGKLGVHVRDEISRQLAGLGLGHVPESLPQYQHDPVRLFKHGTPVGDVIKAVMTPGEPNDVKLREQFGSNRVDHAGIIQKIRELVQE